jgi:hypothetical protein
MTTATTTVLTDKEQAALNFLARNNGCGAKTKAALHDDNFSWFNIRDLMEGLSLSRHEAAGIMSALDAKGLANDAEAGAKVRYDRDSWSLTDKGIDASDLGDDRVGA